MAQKSEPELTNRKTAPCSAAYRQCHPKPQPRSSTRLPASSGSSAFSAGHSPAAESPCSERGIWLYCSKNTLSSYLFSFKKALPLHVFFMVTHLFCGGKPARQAFFVQVRACFAQLAPERLQRRAGVCIIKMRPRDKHKQRGRGC